MRTVRLLRFLESHGAVRNPADAGILSLRPLYTPETAVLNPALVDLWGTILSFRIEPDAKAGYRVILSGEQFLTFRLVQLGTETIEEARRDLDGLRQMLASHRYCGEEDTRSHLREAEDLIAPKGK